MPENSLLGTPLFAARVVAQLGSAASSENLLIKGDNLDVLNALNGEIRGQVKCVYIDPPYNNQEEYTHYIDGQDHDVWLGALSRRLDLLFDFLSEDGSLWISIDDREAHYLKVACDGLFGRDKFVTTIVWNHRKSRENRRVFSVNHEYILVYAKNPPVFYEAKNDLPLTDEILRRYRNPDSDPRGPWQSISANVQAGHATPAQFYEIIAPDGRRLSPPEGRCWIYNRERMEREIANGNIWFGHDGKAVPRIKKFLNAVDRGLTPPTLWSADSVGTTREAKKHILALFPDQAPFDTPKPERLVRRILDIATNRGDLVLDAYLGSGTTAAVAHKMGRRYIGIEIGEHAITLCAERLKAVVNGEPGGISSEVDWTGGGGFNVVDFG